MINVLIKEIRTALEHELYMVALEAALTLPDVCGKAEYKEDKTTNRYINWYRKFIESRSPEEYEYSSIPGVTAEIIYNLRNSLLHQGTPNVAKNNNKYPDNLTVDYFELVQGNPSSANQSLYTVVNRTDDIPPKKITRKISISIEPLCHLLCDTAEEYYRHNSEKFDFINYNYVRSNFVTAQALGLSNSINRI